MPKRYLCPVPMNPDLARQCRRRAVQEGGSLAGMIRGLLIERMLHPGSGEPFSPYCIVQCQFWGPPEATMQLARRLLFIPLDAEMTRDEMLVTALDAVSDRLAQYGGEELGPYGAPVALELHPSAQEIIVYALPGELSENGNPGVV